MKSPLEKTGAWKHASMLWLTANVVGTVLLGLWLLTKGDSNFVAARIIGFFAAGISLPIIPLSVPLFNRILQLPNRQERLYLTFLAVTALFTVTIGLLSIVNLELNLPASRIVKLLFPFYLGAFVATGLVYQQWLFRADE